MAQQVSVRSHFDVYNGLMVRKLQASMFLYANEEGYEIIMTFCCLERSGNEKFMKSGYVYDRMDKPQNR